MNLAHFCAILLYSAFMFFFYETIFGMFMCMFMLMFIFCGFIKYEIIVHISYD